MEGLSSSLLPMLVVVVIASSMRREAVNRVRQPVEPSSVDGIYPVHVCGCGGCWSKIPALLRLLFCFSVSKRCLSSGVAEGSVAASKGSRLVSMSC